jgi:hypothetical protein
MLRLLHPLLLKYRDKEREKCTHALARYYLRCELDDEAQPLVRRQPACVHI